MRKNLDNLVVSLNGDKSRLKVMHKYLKNYKPIQNKSFLQSFLDGIIKPIHDYDWEVMINRVKSKVQKANQNLDFD